MATKRQSTEYREIEAVTKATKRQSAEYREREAEDNVVKVVTLIEQSES